jgi:hypothetical protein
MAVVFLAIFCIDISAAVRPRADLGVVRYRSVEHPMNRADSIEFSVTTRQQGSFFGHIVFYALIEDKESNKYFVSGRGKLPAHNGDGEYLRVTDFYIVTGEDPNLEAYWIGYYYIDSTGEYLLDKKEDHVPDLEKWLEEVKSYTPAGIDMVGTALTTDPEGAAEALLKD